VTIPPMPRGGTRPRSGSGPAAARKDGAPGLVVGAQMRKAAFLRRPFAIACTNGFLLLEVDHAEQSGEIILGTGGEEQLIGGAISPAGCSVAKFNSPELVDLDHLALGVL